MSRFGPPRSGNSKPSYKSKLESKYRHHRKQISRFEGMASIPLSLFQRRRTADKSTGPGKKQGKYASQKPTGRPGLGGARDGRASLVRVAFSGFGLADAVRVGEWGRSVARVSGRAAISCGGSSHFISTELIRPAPSSEKWIPSALRRRTMVPFLRAANSRKPPVSSATKGSEFHHVARGSWETTV